MPCSIINTGHIRGLHALCAAGTKNGSSLQKLLAFACAKCIFLITGRLTEVGGAVREMVGSGQCLQAELLRYLPWFGRRLCVMHFGLPAKP